MKTKRLEAFTLVELLVALGLTALIVGFTLAVSERMLASWSRQNSMLAGRAAARLIFDRLASDLQSALGGDDGRVWLAATILDHPGNSGIWISSPREKPRGAAAGSLRLGPPQLREDRFGQAGVWLRFFTTGRAMRAAVSGEGEQNLPAPVAVAYQLIRRSAEKAGWEGKGRYLLHRSEVRPAAAVGRPGTMETGFDLDPDNVSSAYMQASAGNDGTQIGDPLAIIRPENPDYVLAENVVDFGVRLYRRSDEGRLELIFPLTGHDTVHLARTPPKPRGSGPEMFPSAVEVMVRILTEDGARQLATLEGDAGAKIPRPARFGDDADWWWSVVNANSEVFTCWISLPACDA